MNNSNNSYKNNIGNSFALKHKFKIQSSQYWGLILGTQ